MASFSPKAETALAAVDSSGAFKRATTLYRDVISPDHPVYTPEANRYHIYISYACPWANGVYLALRLKGLDSMIGVSVTHYTWQKTRSDEADKHCGWVFRDRYTVPVLWDKKTKAIVNNESIEILKILNTAFNELLPQGSVGRLLDLFPETLLTHIEETNSWIYPHINNASLMSGVYRCGFAQSQGAYNEAVEEVFQALDRVESILENSRYICSTSQMTAMDIRLFMTLIRFDEVYVVYFKCNKRYLSSYHHISNYMRELYQHPVIHDVIHMDHIKGHYFTSHPTLNTYSIIPAGPNTLEFLSLPHDRNRFD